MGMIGKINPTQLILGGLVIGAGFYLVNRTANKVGEVAGEVGGALNPVNDNNIFNQGVSKIIEDATDGKRKNLGSWLYCVFHPKAISCDKNYTPPIQESV